MRQCKTPKIKANLKKHSSIRMVQMLLPYKWLMLLCFICVITASLVEMAKPYVMKILVDDLLVANAKPHGLFSFWGLGSIYFVIVTLGAFTSMAQVRLLSRVVQSVLASLRKETFTKIMHMSLPALDRYGSGRLITRATNDVEALNEFYSDVLINLFRDIFMLVGIVIIMISMEPKLALVGFSAVPLILLVTLLIKKRLRRNFQEMKALIARINGFFAENIAGSRIIALFNRQINKLREFHDLNMAYFRTTMIQITMNSVMRPIMEVINSLAIALLVVYGYYGITGNWFKVGVLYAFTTYIKQFFEPINDLADKYNTVQSALVSADRIFEILDQEDMYEDITVGDHTGQMIGSVTFDHVWFAYQGEDWVLKDVSFTIEPGQNAAFVGATGAGKTTIISLISKFYTPQKGQIRIDGIPLDQWRTLDLRRQVSVVLQDVFLFSGSLADNIRIYASLTDQQIQEALELSMSDTFVNALPGGIHTELSERGSTLSTGQRQLLCFARAIAHNPSILVLDEATAHIDTHTEKLIQESILRIAEKRTAIFIAHRLSTIRHCDKIFVMQRGEIIESGTHDELIAQKGKYYNLVSTKRSLQES